MKKVFAWLLAVCMMIGMLPVSAVAADGEKAIQLGMTAIKDPTEKTTDQGKYYEPRSYVFYGNNGNTPIKWRVLDADKNNAGSDGMFLLSEYLLASGIQFEAAWNSDDGDGQSNPNEWQHSDAQKWCSDNLRTYFSTQEQNGMLSVNKSDQAVDGLYSINWKESSLSNEKLFFLSVQELADYVGKDDYAPGLKAYTDSTETSAGVWWLRSPSASNSSLSGVVYGVGAVDYRYVDYDGAARPAFNINLNSVLFTSAAVGGKTAETLMPIESTDTNAWKLTLLDGSRKFEVTDQTPVTAMVGNTIDLEYTNATTGDREYISVILADADGALQYYGRIVQPASADGTVSVTLPADLAVGSYTLKVFNEQCNGDKKTDYASDFENIPLTVSAPPVADLPQTGDDSHVVLWLALMGASCMGMMAFAAYGKKRRME